MFTHLAILLALILTPSCKESSRETDAQKAARSQSAASLAEAKSKAQKEAFEENYTVQSGNFVLSEEDKKIGEGGKQNIDFLKNTQNLKEYVPEKQRSDQFYKCETHLAHSYAILDPLQKPEDSLSASAKSLKDSVVVISKDARKGVLGKYEPYSAARAKDGTLYVFFSTEATHDLFYSWFDEATKTWKSPRSLTGIKDFKGLASAGYDKEQGKLVVSVLNLAKGTLISYIESENFSFKASSEEEASSIEAFDQIQAENGRAAQISQGIIMNKMSKSQEEASSMMGTILQNVMTVGGAAIATAVHEEKYLSFTEYYNEMVGKICP